MAASYPTSVKTFSDIVDGTDYMEGAQMNAAYDEIEAVEAMIGASGYAANQNDSIFSCFREYRRGCAVVTNSVAQVTVQAGEVVCVDSSGNTKLRRNTSSTTVTWADIDTGAEASSKRYYVHAVADSAATTFTCVISLSSTAPTGVTTFKLLGSFYNNSSGNIEDVMDDSLLINKTPGIIQAWPTDTAPGGAILCDGSATVGTTTDPTLTDLFGVIANVFGGSDATDFAVPDLRGRTIIGTDDMGQGSADRVTAAAADTIGGSGGTETKDLQHNHGGVTGGANVAASGSTRTFNTATFHHDHDVSNDLTTTEDVMNPYMALNYIIWK